MRTHTLRIGAIALLAGLVVSAQTRLTLAQAKNNPFIGTWTMDRTNSQFSSGRMPAQRTLTFEAVGTDGIRCTIVTRAGDNQGGGGVGETDTSVYTAKFDGKYVPITASTLDTVALKRVNPNKIERTGRRIASMDQVVETQTLEVSADGKTLTIVTKGTNLDGNEYESKQVFTRM